VDRGGRDGGGHGSALARAQAGAGAAPALTSHRLARLRFEAGCNGVRVTRTERRCDLESAPSAPHKKLASRRGPFFFFACPPPLLPGGSPPLPPRPLPPPPTGA